jgi:hypothetical protein
MPVNYVRPAFDKPLFKAPRGSSTLKKEKAEKDATAEEILVKKDVKARDVKCRWPVKHKCRGGLECAHLVDISRGGAMTTGNLILLCKWTHRTGPQSVHGKDLRIEPLTDRGADGPCAFYQRFYIETRAGDYRERCVGRESAPGRLEK